MQKGEREELASSSSRKCYRTANNIPFSSFDFSSSSCCCRTLFWPQSRFISVLDRWPKSKHFQKCPTRYGIAPCSTRRRVFGHKMPPVGKSIFEPKVRNVRDGKKKAPTSLKTTFLRFLSHLLRLGGSGGSGGGGGFLLSSNLSNARKNVSDAGGENFQNEMKRK